mmetsp:Transcript_15181/g.65003  ORF Transcript_15181/g.65003 Transcript_15181/m.65003 type:complete len:439 (+) Transcript_15181:2455-3771(+)
MTITDSASGGAAKPLSVYATLSPASGTPLPDPPDPAVLNTSVASNEPGREGLNVSGKTSRRPFATTMSRPTPANASASAPVSCALTTMLVAPPFTSGISCVADFRATHENSRIARSSLKPAANSSSTTRTSCIDPRITIAGYVPASRTFKPSCIGVGGLAGRSVDILADAFAFFSKSPLQVAFFATQTVSSTSTNELLLSATYSIEDGHASPAMRAFIASARSARFGCFSRKSRRARSNGGFWWSTATSNVCGRTSSSALIFAAGGGRSALPSSSTTNLPLSTSSKTRCATCAPIAKGRNATSTVTVPPPRTRAATRSAPNAPGYFPRRTRGRFEDTKSASSVLRIDPSRARVSATTAATPPRALESRSGRPRSVSFLAVEFVALRRRTRAFSLSPLSIALNASAARGSSRRRFTHVTANSQSAGNGFGTETVATVIS